MFRGAGGRLAFMLLYFGSSYPRGPTNWAFFGSGGGCGCAAPRPSSRACAFISETVGRKVLRSRAAWLFRPAGCGLTKCGVTTTSSSSVIFCVLRLGRACPASGRRPVPEPWRCSLITRLSISPAMAKLSPSLQDHFGFRFALRERRNQESLQVTALAKSSALTSGATLRSIAPDGVTVGVNSSFTPNGLNCTVITGAVAPPVRWW